jgi:hypothetical protein
MMDEEPGAQLEKLVTNSKYLSVDDIFSGMIP